MWLSDAAKRVHAVPAIDDFDDIRTVNFNFYKKLTINIYINLIKENNLFLYSKANEYLLLKIKLYSGIKFSFIILKKKKTSPSKF